MAHMIDETTGAAAIAYLGETPWHELGHEMAAGASIEEWTDKAGLDWKVLRSPVLFQDARRFCGPLPSGYVPIQRFSDRDVLYRSDTGAPLGIASNDYKVVQPKDVMSFFDAVVKLGDFQLETAGALSGGKRIWALARIHDGAPIIGQDLVRPYLLLTTSFDGNMATTAKLTAIRVVCHNTLSVAIRNNHGSASEAVGTTVKVNHAMQFDARDVRMQLGIFADTFGKWVIQTRRLARQKIDRETASRMALELTSKIPFRTRNPKPVEWPRESPAYHRIMALFDGQAIGSDLSEGPTKWQFINSVTQWIDHERGRDPGSRLNSAWYGLGEALKRKAYEIALGS
jgi:phage/plasmid-like protein (TIGR03299 family)